MCELLSISYFLLGGWTEVYHWLDNDAPNVGILGSSLGRETALWTGRSHGSKGGERDRGGEGDAATRGVERVSEGDAIGPGARTPSVCGRCGTGRDGLGWSGR